MIKSMFQKGPLPALEAAMRMRQQRHVLLANNVANAQNPHYRSQDVDLKPFQKMLSDALEARDQGATKGLELSSTEGLRVEGGTFTLQPQDAWEGSMPPDRNTVVMEREMTKLLRNGLHMQALGQMVDQRYRALEEAWRGRIR